MSANRSPSLAKRIVKPFIPKSWILKRAFPSDLLQDEAELKIIPFLCRRHQTSIDVGANIGLYSYLFYKWSNNVIAIEPHPDLASRLRTLLPSSVQVINIAASDHDGVSDFFIPMVDGVEISSRSSLEDGANSELGARRIRVETRRLDSLSLAPRTVAIAKIDVEGHELSTLQGMTSILEQSHPTLIVESETRLHHGAPQIVFNFLKQYGYEGYFIHRDQLKPISDFSVGQFQNETNVKPVFGARSPDYVNNFIFVHLDRLDVIDAIAKVYPLRMPNRLSEADRPR
jgi:FkbM family methyltransferase